MDETTAVQDYLKAIHQLGGDREPVPTSALAERLGVKPASVSGMLKRLDGQRLVRHVRYRGVRLTARGTRGALEVIRHHRLLETYLERVVGMPWDKVHDEADALEHVISEELEARLDELLGHPTEDPHGHPIPSADLELREVFYPALGDCGDGDRLVVRRVNDGDPDLLRHLGDLGLRPGACVDVLEVVPYGGGVRARIDGDEQLVGTQAAEAVHVSRRKR